MIRYICNRKTGEFQAISDGSLSDVLAELGVLLSTSYNLLRSRSPEAAEAFRAGVCCLCQPSSPVWDKEDIPDPQEGIKLVRAWKREERT